MSITLLTFILCHKGNQLSLSLFCRFDCINLSEEEWVKLGACYDFNNDWFGALPVPEVALQLEVAPEPQHQGQVVQLGLNAPAAAVDGGGEICVEGDEANQSPPAIPVPDNSPQVENIINNASLSINSPFNGLPVHDLFSDEVEEGEDDEDTVDLDFVSGDFNKFGKGEKRSNSEVSNSGSTSPPIKKRRGVTVVKQEKWLLIKQKDGEVIGDEVSPFWFLNSANRESNSVTRREELSKEGVSTVLKVITRLIPFESQTALARKVYAFLLAKEFNSKIKKSLPLSLDPAEREKLVNKHSRICHNKITPLRVREGCNLVAASIGLTSYARLSMCNQTVKEAAYWDVLMNVKKYDFEYEFHDIN